MVRFGERLTLDVNAAQQLVTVAAVAQQEVARATTSEQVRTGAVRWNANLSGAIETLQLLKRHADEAIHDLVLERQVNAPIARERIRLLEVGERALSTVRALPTVDGYTLDERLGEFRKLELGKMPEYVKVNSRKGQQLYRKLMGGVR